MKISEYFPVTCHTDFVGKGSTFVAINGQNQKGADYVAVALKKGATTIVVEEIDNLQTIKQHVKQAKAQLKIVKNARVALAKLSAKSAGYPSKKLKLLGITGTKGKTTTAHMLYHFLTTAGYKTALLSTVENKIGSNSFEAPLTTPQPDYLHQFFKLCVQNNVEYVVMEVAAQAMTFNRIETLEFDGLIFTNLDREHGELYRTMQEYFAEKCLLFNYRKHGAPVLINSDDKYGKIILQKFPKFLSYFAQQVEGLSCSHFPGMFNQSNLAAAVGLCKQLGLTSEILQKAVSTLPPLQGRLEEYVLPNNVRIFIDYAHTPASFKALFKTVRPWTENLIVLFGAGGGKDKHKRPLMGAVAAEYADTIVLTSDNSRDEDPQHIIKAIISGIGKKDYHKVIVEIDRKQALKKAYKKAQPNSIILLLGKGPDEYQVVGNTVVFFSEKDIILQL